MPAQDHYLLWHFALTFSLLTQKKLFGWIGVILQRMMTIFKKEFNQYFGSLTGFLSIGLFLLLMGLFLFIFPATSLLDYGYATLEKFFELAPWVLLLLVPAVTMRSFSEEFKSGTWELLKTRPVSIAGIVGGKYLASFLLVVLAVLPTLVYVFTLKSLSINGSLDWGAIAGSYIGLLLLVAVFTAIGLWCSSLTQNPIVAFLLAAFICFAVYNAFSALSSIAGLKGGVDYWVNMLGINDHYLNISRGVLEIKDLLYFFVVTAFFLLLTGKQIGA